MHICIHELPQMIMVAEKFCNLLSAYWKPKEAGGIIPF